VAALVASCSASYCRLFTSCKQQQDKQQQVRRSQAIVGKAAKVLDGGGGCTVLPWWPAAEPRTAGCSHPASSNKQ
jgi:hypothetical protein